MHKWMYLFILCFLFLIGCEGNGATQPLTVKEHAMNEVAEQSKAAIQSNEYTSDTDSNIEVEDQNEKAYEQPNEPKNGNSSSFSENQGSEKSKENGAEKQSTKSETKTETTTSNKKESSVPANAITFSLIGKDGEELVENISVEIGSDTTVLDVLMKVAKERGIAVSVIGSKSTAYIEGVNGLFEFDYGPKSGWVFRVNNQVPTKSCGIYQVFNGDEVLWTYTEDYGNNAD